VSIADYQNIELVALQIPFNPWHHRPTLIFAYFCHGSFNVSVSSSVRKAVMSFALRQWEERWRCQIIGLLTNQQRLPRNVCKTEWQPLILQNKSQINIIFTLHTTMLPPCTLCIGKTWSLKIPMLSHYSGPTLCTEPGIPQLFYGICNMFRYSFIKGFGKKWPVEARTFYKYDSVKTNVHINLK
jgi:hypothetical protein